MLVATLLLFLVSISHSLDYHNLIFDDVSGDMIKPANWSLAKYQLVQQLRIKELIHSKKTRRRRDARLFPEEDDLVDLEDEETHSRVRRNVETGVTSQAISMNVGHYLEERLMLPTLTPADSFTLSSAVDDISFSQEFIQGTTTFVVSIKASTNAIQLTLYNNESPGQKIIFEDTNAAGTILDLAAGGKVSAAALEAVPGVSSKYFLALAVDAPVGWPTDADLPGDRTDEAAIQAFMEKNFPVVVGDNAGSRVYDLSISETKFTLTLTTNVPTIEAKDVAFIQEDDTLFLVFAHRGNRMPHGVMEAESTLLKFVPINKNFEIIQGYKGLDSDNEIIKTEGDFISRNPQRLLQFKVHTRQYLVFVNYDRDTFSKDEPEEGFSYVYTYDWSTRKMRLVQKLLTFAAMDATVFNIEDPFNPINSQWFLIFAVNQGGDDEKIDSLVFKWIDGRFLPYQSIPIPGRGKVISVESHSASTTVEGVDVLEHWVAFLTESVTEDLMALENLYLYQYNGYNFELVNRKETTSAFGCPLTFTVVAPETPIISGPWTDPSGDYTFSGMRNDKPSYSKGALGLFYNSVEAKWMVDDGSSLDTQAIGLISSESSSSCPPTTKWRYQDDRAIKPVVLVSGGTTIPKLDTSKVPKKLRVSTSPQVVYENGNVRLVTMATFPTTAPIPFNKFYDVSKNIRSFIDEAKKDLPDSVILSIKEEFNSMPKTTDSNVQLDDVVFEGAVSVTNLKIAKEFCLKDIDGVCTNQPSLEVTDKTTLDAAMVDDFIQYIDGSYTDNLDSLDTTLTTIKGNIAAQGVNVKEGTTLTNDVVFKKLTAAKVTASELRLQSPVNDKGLRPLIQKTADSTPYDFVNFIKNSIQRPGAEQTVNLKQDLVFDNIKIEGEYNIGDLNGEDVGNYWQSFNDQTVAGLTTFKTGPTISKNAAVDGTVGGKTFTTSKILVDKIDQTFDHGFDLQNEVTIVKLQTDKINDVDLSLMNSLASYTNVLSFSKVSLLEVDTLELPKLTLDTLDIDVQGDITEVHMKDLVDHSMKKSQDNTVMFKYDFKSNVSATEVQSSLVNSEVFEDIFNPLSEGEVLSGNFVFSELDIGAATIKNGETINSVSSDQAIATQSNAFTLTGCPPTFIITDADGLNAEYSYKNMFNGRPLYHSGGNYQMFFHAKASEWKVDTPLNAGKAALTGLLYNPTTSTALCPPTSGWEFQTPSAQKPTVQEGPCKSAYMIVSTEEDILQDLTNPFTFKFMLNSKPVYTSPTGYLYLFYNTQISKWKVDLASNLEGVGTGVIYNSGSSSCPPTSGWVYYDNRNAKPVVAEGCASTFSITTSEDFSAVKWWKDLTADYSFRKMFNGRPLYSDGDSMNLFYHAGNSKWMVDWDINIGEDVQGMISAVSSSLCPPTSGWEYFEAMDTKPQVVVSSVTSPSVHDAVAVDTNGHLELIIQSDKVLAGFTNAVADGVEKTLVSVESKEDVTVTDDNVLGFDLSLYDGTKVYSEKITVSNLKVNNVQSITTLDLDNGGQMYIDNDDIRSSVNWVDMETNALKRDLTSWPSSVTSVTFTGKADFQDDLAVTALNDQENSINDVNPDTDFVQTSSSASITFPATQTLTFAEGLKLSKTPKLYTNSFYVKTCKLASTGQCLCNDCSNAKCQQIGDECVIVSGDVPDLYDGSVTEDLVKVGARALRVTGDQTVTGNVKFDAGLTADSAHVTSSSCVIDQVNCDSIALNNMAQTFTGLNTFHGDMDVSVVDLSISSSLKVLGTVDGVNVDTAYTDTLFIDNHGCALQITVTTADDLSDLTGVYTFSRMFNGRPLYTKGNLVLFYHQLSSKWAVDDRAKINDNPLNCMLKQTTSILGICPPTSGWVYHDGREAKPTVQNVGAAPGADQEITGAKTFGKDIEVSNLYTDKSFLSDGGSKSWLSSNGFNDNEYVLRDAGATSITSNLHFSEKVTVDNFAATSRAVTWDGVALSKFFDNLLDNTREQSITGDLTVKSDLTISSGLSKDTLVDTAVNTINKIDIVDVNSKALTIDDSQGLTTLKDVVFDEIEVNDQGLLLEENAKFLGLDVSKVAVTVNGPLSMDTGLIKYKGGLEVTGDISMTGDLKNEAGSVTVDQDELWNFLKNDVTVTKVKVSHASGATAAKEPTITNVNSQSLSALRSNYWHQGDNVNLAYNIKFDGDVEVTSGGKLKTSHLDSSSMGLATIRDTYLSKGTSQTITADYTFTNDISFTAPLSVDKVDIKNDGVEGTLETSVSQKFKDRNDKVLMLNSNYGSIAATLNPDSVDALKNVVTSSKINDLNLCSEVLTYTNEKTFTSPITLSGDLTVVKGGDSGTGTLNVESKTVGNIILRSREDINIDSTLSADNIHLATIPEFGPQFVLSFDLLVRSLSSSDSCGLIQVNVGSSGVGPWVVLKQNALRIWWRFSMDGNNAETTQAYDWSFDNVLSVGQWIPVKIEQTIVAGQHKVRISVNGVEAEYASGDWSYNDAKVIIAPNHGNRANAVIKNLVISQSGCPSVYSVATSEDLSAHFEWWTDLTGDFTFKQMFNGRPLYSNGDGHSLWFNSGKWIIDSTDLLPKAFLLGKLYTAASSSMCPPSTGWNYPLVGGVNFEFIPIVRATSFDVEAKMDDAVHHTDPTTEAIAISGNVRITGQPTFTELGTGSNSINGKCVGLCSTPLIMTTDSCGSSSVQQFGGSITFGAANGKQDLTVTKINLPDGAKVNNVVWQDLLDEMVDRKAVGTVNVAKKTTFQQEKFAIDEALSVTFESNLFGLSSANVDKVLNMAFASGDNTGDKPNMPDLADALETIKDNSYNFPDQFLYMTPLYTVPSATNRAKTIGALEGLTGLTDQAAWDALPFHAVTLLGATDGDRQIQFIFRKLSIDGNTLTNVAVGTNLNAGMDEDSYVFGDIVVWERDSIQIYVLLFKDSVLSSVSELKYLSWAEGKLQDVEAALGATFSMETKGLNDLEPVRMGAKSCFIGCGDKVQMLCAGSSDSLFTFPNAQNCFKASTEVVDSAQSIVVAAVNKGVSSGQIIVYSSSNAGTYSEVQSIRCYMCTSVDTGKHGDTVFLVLTSQTYSFTYIGKYNPTSNKFEVFQSLQLERPSEALFFNQDGALHLSIITGTGSNSKINRFIYRGAMGFVEVPKMALKLGEVTSHQFIVHPLLESTLLSTTGGTTDPFTTLTSNSLFQTTVKQTSMTEWRAEADSKPAPTPSIISENCKNMVLAYTNKLYKEANGADNADAFSRMVMRLLPRPFIDFSAELFPEKVQAEFVRAGKELVYSDIPEATVLFYKYTNFAERTRDLTSTGFVGSAFIFQDLDQLLYIRARLLDNALSGVRAVTFWTSCDKSATQLTASDYSSAGNSYKPSEDNLPLFEKGRDLCYMFHDFDSTASQKIKNIRGDASIAAVRIQLTNNGYACGYMKQPEQAFLNFKKFHANDNVEDGLMLIM